jgi:hypothetical protein
VLNSPFKYLTDIAVSDGTQRFQLPCYYLCGARTGSWSLLTANGDGGDDTAYRCWKMTSPSRNGTGSVTLHPHRRASCQTLRLFACTTAPDPPLLRIAFLQVLDLSYRVDIGNSILHKLVQVHPPNHNVVRLMYFCDMYNQGSQ